ncbi:hypothetical protein DFH08DRAFT_806244 [Mycena albidolilacea]|uniref:Uncharacterized protein n=1 Tax=Mycena albidolilacea TaxID=1033008 RepID=A0AAD7A8Y3_9AGAR|nr:hypothetical protein DFH08DRAFT_806244 [Mycena albidolilacea]
MTRLPAPGAERARWGLGVLGALDTCWKLVFSADSSTCSQRQLGRSLCYAQVSPGQTCFWAVGWDEGPVETACGPKTRSNCCLSLCGLMGPGPGLKLARNTRSSLRKGADEVAEDWCEATESLSEEGEDGGLELGEMGMNGAGSPPCSWYSVQSKSHIRSKVGQGAPCQRCAAPTLSDGK